MPSDPAEPSSMLLPQPGIFAQGTRAHYFLEFDLRPGVAAATALASFRRLRAPELSAGGVNLVVAFAGAAWRELAGPDAPPDLRPFAEIEGLDGHRAPATQHDAWLWFSAGAPDVVWEHAWNAARRLADVAVVASEQAGFAYREGRDLTGFVDGTANPPTRRSADVAIVPPGRPGEGGSFVLVQRWVHDLDAFERLTVPEQEAVFGRTKEQSLEIPEPSRAATAHIARVQVQGEAGELEILRRSVPYGTVREHGLYFVAFSAEQDRFDRMLARMFGRGEGGPRDRLTDFSRAVSGAYYFAPSLNALRRLAGPEPE